MNMNCNKNCNCTECEMSSSALITIVNDDNPFCETRRVIEGFKCLKMGALSKEINGCKFSHRTNDLIFKSLNEEDFNYFNRRQ